MSARDFLAAHLSRGRPSLDAALLTDQGAGYAAMRVSLIGLRALLRASVHAIEIWFLIESFPFEFILPLLGLRAIPGLIGGVHWGALEALRERVRRELGRSQRESASASIEAYLMLVLVVSGLVCTGLLALVASSDDPLSAPLGLYGLFVIVVAVAAAIESWTRTYHSGVFALGRVYRPAASMVLPDLFDLACVVGLWGVLGPFSLHAVVLFGALLRGGLAVHYSNRAYRMRGLRRPRVLRLRALSRLSFGDARAGLRHALATSPLQLDRVLLLSLLHARPPHQALALSLPFYALRPIASFAQSWARSFYPDFVRLNAFGVGILRVRFERLLARVAVVTGLLAAAGLAAGAYLMFGIGGLEASAWLVPLCLVRARFALEQVRSFAYSSERELVIATVVLGLGFVLADHLHFTDRQLVVLVACTLTLALLLGRVARRRAGFEPPLHGRRIALSSWLARVSSLTVPVRISLVRVDQHICSAATVQRAIADALQDGYVARAGRAWLLWWEPLAQARPHTSWARALAGSVAELESVSADNGPSALALARTRLQLPRDLATALEQPAAQQTAAMLRQSAANTVAAVEAIELATGSEQLARLPPPQLALIRRAVIAAAREQNHIPKRAPFQVAVYAPGGEPVLVFVWPSRAPGSGALHTRIRHATWRASVP